LRFKQPNKEHMKMPALHSLEHLMAELSRNHSDKIVDISPMGCQTGFNLSLINHDNYDDVLDLLEKVLEDVVQAKEVPACNEVQCRWAGSHRLEKTQQITKEKLAKKNEWYEIF